MRSPLLLAALALALAPSLAHANGPKKEAGPAQTYIGLPLLNASIAKLTGGRTLLSVEVGLDIPDAALREKAGLVLPRLRSAYNETLQAYGATLPMGAPPNADLLAGRLQQSTDATLGKAGARVLLGSVVIN